MSREVDPGEPRKAAYQQLPAGQELKGQRKQAGRSGPHGKKREVAEYRDRR